MTHIPPLKLSACVLFCTSAITMTTLVASTQQSHADCIGPQPQCPCSITSDIPGASLLTVTIESVAEGASQTLHSAGPPEPRSSIEASVDEVLYNPMYNPNQKFIVGMQLSGAIAPLKPCSDERVALVPGEQYLVAAFLPDHPAWYADCVGQCILESCRDVGPDACTDQCLEENREACLEQQPMTEGWFILLGAVSEEIDLGADYTLAQSDAALLFNAPQCTARWPTPDPGPCNDTSGHNGAACSTTLPSSTPPCASPLWSLLAVLGAIIARRRPR